MNVEAILQFELFNNVGPDIVKNLISSLSISTFQTGDYLITRDKPNRQFFLLLEGSVEIYLNENDKPLDIIARKECIGEISLLDCQPASAHVIAISECQVIMIDKDDIWQMTKKSQTFTFNLLSHLVVRLRKFNGQVDSLIKAQNLIEKRATIDSLTGLHNRRWIDEQFNQILNRCKDEHQSLSIIMIDIDHFKQINDQYGHVVGDIVLHKTGEILLQHVRERDAAVRYGGDELSLILPNTEPEHSI